MSTDPENLGRLGRKYRWRETQCKRLRSWDYCPGKWGGRSGTCVWKDNRTGRETGLITWRMWQPDERWYLELVYRSNETPFRDEISMASDPVAGTRNQRWWFHCPECDRRCGVIYKTPDPVGFRCRVCASVTYASQQEVPLSRAAMRCGIRIPDGMTWGDFRKNR